MNAAVFIDRDNTLIQNDGDLGDPERVQLLQGAASAIASLRGLGYKIIVITNQGGVARGVFGEDDVRAVHDRIEELVSTKANGAKIDRFYYCPYHPDGKVKKYKKDHPTRKPKPGMLLDAAKEFGLDLSQSWTVGDQMRDVEAGAAAGTRTILIRPDADQLTPRDLSRLSELRRRRDGDQAEAVKPDYIASSLIESVRIIAQQRKPEAAEALGRGGVLPKRWDAAAVARIQQARQQVTTSHESSNAGRAAREQVVPAQPKPVRLHSPPPATESQTTSSDVVTPAPEKKPQPPRAVESVPDEPAGSDRTLRMILQELRSQRGGEDEFSYMSIFAIVLQLVAAVCLLGGLWMGADDQAVFLRWIGAGVLIQLATIAILMFNRKK